MTRPVDREVVIRGLERQRARSPFLRGSVLLLGAAAAYAWMAGDLGAGELLAAHRVDNLRRFLGELRPYPVQGHPWDTVAVAEWSWDLLGSRGARAALATLAMSIAAIVLAAAAGAALTLPAARTVASAEPYAPAARPPAAWTRALWSGAAGCTRALLIFLRAVPEYMWAFLVLAVLGPSVWAAVAALALHNAGILAKLTADVVENLDPRPAAALREAGGSRLQIALAALGPALLPRFLLFFFYRWETCVREATVLGMLGIASIGFVVQDARARQYYDVMFALILTGSAIVLAGDLLSALARRAVRRST